MTQPHTWGEAFAEVQSDTRQKPLSNLPRLSYANQQRGTNMKIAAFVIAGSLAVLALGLVVLPFGMGVADGAQQRENVHTFERVADEIAAEPTADEVFKSVADAL